MRTVRTFLSLIFAIYVAVRGLEFIRHQSIVMVLLGIGCIFLAFGTSYIAVKSLIKNK